MSEKRPAVPAELERRLLVEAGHRCAITTCRQAVPLELEHIDDWAKVKEHKFENMIAICRNCHGRKGNGPGQIDRKSLRQYKANPAILNSRYSDVEERMMTIYAKAMVAHPDDLQTLFNLPQGSTLLVLHLLLDGYLVPVTPGPGLDERFQWYRFTESGTDFAQRWAAGRTLDGITIAPDEP